MRLKVVRTIELLALAFLLMPAGMLLAVETSRPSTANSSTASWYDTMEANDLFNGMQQLAVKTQKDIGQVQIQVKEMSWQAQSDQLALVRNDINKIGDNLVRLQEIKNGLEPWQQNLVGKVAARVHEMVYQTDAAIEKLNSHENRTYLALSDYPNNVNAIEKNASQMAGTIGTVTQYVRSEQKMAAIEGSTGNIGS